MAPKPFQRLHPAVAFAFFAAALLLTVLVAHPAFQVVGLAGAIISYLSFAGRSGLRSLAALAAAFCLLTLANPLFIPQGQTVLFTYLGQRPYTLQGLAMGASTAAMLVTALLWFGCFNRVVTSEKLTFLFGRLAPSLTLMLTMVLRLVPLYQRKARQISAARRCVGLSAWEGPATARIRSGAAELSALTTWGLEGAIVTADSMRSRGFGSGPRTPFATYPFTGRDIALAALLTVLLVAAGAAAATVGETRFLPAFAFAPLSPVQTVGLLAWGLFSLMPALVNGREALQWRIISR